MSGKIKYIISMLLVQISICACVSEFTANLPFSGEEILVIEGDIIANSKVNIQLSKAFSLNEETVPEDYNEVSANIVIIGDDGYRSSPATYLGKGIHQIEVGDLDPNVSYGIEIEYENELYRSTLSTPAHTPDIEVEWTQEGTDGEIVFTVSAISEDSKPQYYMWTYVEDWEIHSFYKCTVFYDPVKNEYHTDESAPNYYCWRKEYSKEVLIGNTELLSGNSIVKKKLYAKDNDEDERFSILYSTLIRQQAISKAAYEYYLNIRENNEEMGGLFTPQPAEIESNITCITNPSRMIIGFVDVAANVVEKRIYISSNEVQTTFNPLGCGLWSTSQLTSELETIKQKFHEFGFFPVYEEDVWGYAPCVDCRLNGGSKNKPDFWPNNHQ